MDIGMNLDRIWSWGQKKLNCRIRIESGNPAADALRDNLHMKLAELANVNLQDLLADMKKVKEPVVEKKRKELKNTAFVLSSAKSWESSHLKDRSSPPPDLRSTSNDKSDLKTEAVPDSLREVPPVTPSLRNIRNTKYLAVPKSPPRRLLLELTRERAKPAVLLDQLDVGEKPIKTEVNKPAKKRQLKLSAVDITTKLGKSNTLEGSGRVTLARLNVKDYQGDKFSNRGSYLEGMLYLSRMENASTRKEAARKASSMMLPVNAESSSAAEIGDTSGFSPGAKDARRGSATNFNDDDSEATEVSTKLYCAACLCNWSRVPSNAQQLAKEGAVRAIMQLCNEQDPRIHKFCAAAFRYMSESPLLGAQMVEENSISVMSELVNSGSSEFVSGSIAIALVNLTRIAGKEEKLVESGIIIAIQTEIQVRPDLNAACARALYNLTCVDSQYNSIERVIRMLVTLSTISATSVKHICAAALCVCSICKHVNWINTLFRTLPI